MQFDRLIRVTVGEPGKSGIVVEDLRIKFSVDKDLTQETNKATIEIWNMREDNQMLCEEDDSIVIIEAGYKNDVGLIKVYQGYIISAFTRADGKETVTRIDASDGQLPIRDSVLSIGYGAGVNGRQIITDVAAKMGLIINIAADVEFVGYPSGFSYVGKPREVLSKVCDASGLNWSIQNNQLQVIYNAGFTGIKALLFDAESGLIGSPERIVKAARKADNKYYSDKLKVTSSKPSKKKSKKRQRRQRKANWKIKTLLAPTVNPGDAVGVDSRAVEGWFRVEAVKHEGDNFGGDFTSQMDLEEVVLDEQ